MRCSIDVAGILQARVLDLEEGCASEDDLELEGDREDSVEETTDDEPLAVRVCLISAAVAYLWFSCS